MRASYDPWKTQTCRARSVSALGCAEEQSPAPAVDGEGCVEKIDRERTGVRVGPLLNNGSFKFVIGLDAPEEAASKDGGPQMQTEGNRKGTSTLSPTSLFWTEVGSRRN